MPIINRIIFIIILLPTLVVAQQTIPTYHWAYDYLDYLQLRGFLKELNSIQKPYTTSQVEQSLERLNEEVLTGKVKLTSQDRWILDYLNKEFGKKFSDTEKDMRLRLGMWADETVQFHENETQPYTQLRSRVGLQFKENFYFYNGMLLDQFLYNDPEYTGNKWRGFAGYAEQGYIRYKNSFLNITFGRDFLKWGSGKTGRLLFSDNMRPLDLFAVTLNYKAISMTAIAANLDQWSLADSLVQKHHVATANRYLSVHRMTLNLPGNLNVGFTELLLYGGPHSTWELKYHNPLLYFHGELLNHGGYNGNGMLYLDMDWHPWKNWKFYGELLIDDYQLEETVPGDLEPNEVGVILGFQKSGFPGVSGMTVGAEFVRVTNRTYNSNLDWEKYVHYNRPIGYYLGNNFDQWHFTADYWFPKKIKFGLAFDYIQKGEGAVLDQWDEPWRAFTVAQGYDEPFPYGIVESSFITTMNLRWHVKANLFVDVGYRYQDIENVEHQTGINQSAWETNIKLHWNINTFFDY